MSSRSQVCKYFLSDACRKGNACPFLHEDGAVVQRQSSSMDVCLYFQKGACLFGDRCRNKHVMNSVPSGTTAPSRSIPCKFYPLGECLNGENCLYKHEGPALGSPSSSTSGSSTRSNDSSATSISTSFSKGDTTRERNESPELDVGVNFSSLKEPQSGQSSPEELPVNDDVQIKPEDIPLPHSTSPSPPMSDGWIVPKAADTSQSVQGKTVADTELPSPESDSWHGRSSQPPYPQFVGYPKWITYAPPYLDPNLPYSSYHPHGAQGHAASPTNLSPLMLPLAAPFPQSRINQLQLTRLPETPRTFDHNTTLCQQYALNGWCPLGVSCGFRHFLTKEEFAKLSSEQPHPPPPRITVSSDGEDTTERHLDTFSSSQTPREARFKEGFKPNRACHFYAQGRCRKGDNCTFLHESETGDSNRAEAETSTPAEWDTGDNGWNNAPSWDMPADDPDLHTTTGDGWGKSQSTPWDTDPANKDTKRTRKSKHRRYEGDGAASSSSSGRRSPVVPIETACDGDIENTEDRDVHESPDEAGCDAEDSRIELDSARPQSPYFEDHWGEPVEETHDVPKSRHRRSVWDSESDTESEQDDNYAQVEVDEDAAETWKADWSQEGAPPDIPEAGKIALPCKFFGQGHCSKGDRCRYLHIPQEMPTSDTESEGREQAPSADGNMASDDTAQRVIFNCLTTFGPGVVPHDITTAYEGNTVMISNLPLSMSGEFTNALDEQVCSFGDVLEQETEIDGDAVHIRVEYASNDIAAAAVKSLNNFNLLSTRLAAHIMTMAPIEFNRPPGHSAWIRITYPTPYRNGWLFYNSITLAKQMAQQFNGKSFRGRPITATYSKVRRTNQKLFAISLENLPVDGDREAVKKFYENPDVIEFTAPTYTDSPITQIRQLLFNCGEIENFEILSSDLSQPHCVILARFSQVDSSELAVQNWNNTQHQFLGGATLNVVRTYCRRYDITPRKYTTIEADIQRLRELHSPSCTVQCSRGEDTIYCYAFSDDPFSLGKAQKDLEHSIWGEMMRAPGSDFSFWDSYFDHISSQKVIDKINEDPTALVELDHRCRQVRLFGNDAAKGKARTRLLKFVDRAAAMSHTIDLSPPTIWSLLNGGFAELEQAGVKLQSISLDLVAPALVIRGDIDAFTTANRIVAQLAQSATPSRAGANRCSVCLQAAVDMVELSCAHRYCRRCILEYLKFNISPNFRKLVCLANIESGDEDQDICSAEIPYSIIRSLLSTEETADLLEASFIRHIEDQSQYRRWVQQSAVLNAS
ncbi:hypothetical protein VNI00_000654 [Paramarasmius palmivorus]|uniref:RING-type E3 ubiquitin transferase n=1 Tax=Paramarasmius palmivorus TaxID=297713 RepID=A0AAW0E5U4_9AGAR